MPPLRPTHRPLQVMIRDAVDWKTPPDTTFTKGQQIEAIDSPDEADSVRWRGVVHKFDAAKQQVRGLSTPVATSAASSNCIAARGAVVRQP